jgi:beta-glucosidase
MQWLDQGLNSSHMPEGFLWGAATSAYQIEGAAREDGRGEAIWDRFCARPDAITDGSNASVACDHYHRYRQDIDLIQRLNLTGYRFSISWPRVLPTGTGRINSAGLDFYDRLVDALLEAGLRPFATLYHWDAPQALQDRWGGWAHRDMAMAFGEYTDAVSRRLGDRVVDWLTLHAPSVQAWYGYGAGTHAPGVRKPNLFPAVAHHMLLGHARALPILRQNSATAHVGIALALSPVYPRRDEDAEAASLYDGAMNRLFLDALYRGAYPHDVLARLDGEMPWIRSGDMAAIAAPLDFLDVGYITRTVVEGDRAHLWPGGRVVSGGSLDDIDGAEVFAEGLYDVLQRVWHDYAPAAIYATVAGAEGDDMVGPDGAVHDTRRIGHLRDHLAVVEQAIGEGIPVRGYFAQPLLDDFAWTAGFTMRRGLIYHDRLTQDRVIKDSGHWYAQH